MSSLLTFIMNMSIVVVLIAFWAGTVWYAYRTGIKDGQALLRAEIRRDEAEKSLAEARAKNAA